MKKETRGRPKKRPSERKSKRISVRSTESDFALLVEQYGSIQAFFDNCIAEIKTNPKYHQTIHANSHQLK